MWLQGTQTGASSGRRDELIRDQNDDKPDSTKRMARSRRVTKELALATISLVGGETVGRLIDQARARAKVLLGLQLWRLTAHCRVRPPLA